MRIQIDEYKFQYIFIYVIVSERLAVKGAFSSSIHHNTYDATNAIDGNLENFFHSNDNEKNKNPWLQVELKEICVIHSIIVFNRKNCCGERTKNMRVGVGFTKFVKGMETLDLRKNEVCATYEGPGKNGEEISIHCKAPMRGQYVSVQLMQTSNAILNLGEIEIYGQPGKI